MDTDKHILAINFGSTSTKVAWFVNDACTARSTLRHDPEHMAGFATLMDQYAFRKQALMEFLDSHGLDPRHLAAVVSRGGQTRPLPSGCYTINQTMLDDITSEVYGVHPTNLGVIIAADLAREWGCAAMVVDPPVSDEFEPVARLTGIPEITRHSRFHVLNQKAAARRLCDQLGLVYEECRLVGVHLGGGISVAAHCLGRLVDANNALDGDGPYSTSRAGTVQSAQLVELCFSGRFSKPELLRKITGEGGVQAYLKTTDMIAVERAAARGDELAELVLDGMCYQTAKEIGAMAAVLKGQVDFIFMTGGIAHSEEVTGRIRERVAFIAPVHVLPGEDEMEALAQGAYRALLGERPLLELQSHMSQGAELS